MGTQERIDTRPSPEFCLHCGNLIVAHHPTSSACPNVDAYIDGEDEVSGEPTWSEDPWLETVWSPGPVDPEGKNWSKT